MDMKKKCVINGKHVDDFNCAICHEVYENPRNLQCSHSFCLKCIISYIRQQYETRSATNFDCPLCRGNIGFSIARLRNVIYKDELEEDEVKCIFPKNIALASATENLNVEQEFCTEHPTKIYEYFCKDDKILCCSKCVIESHRNCKHVKDMDECDQQEFGRLVQDSQLILRTSFKKCDKKVASLESTRQRAVNSLENLKSDIVDAITKAQDKVNEITTKEIENVKQQYGPLPQPVPNGYTCNRQAFTLEIQNISSRITDVKRKNIKTNLGAKIAVPIQDARASVKRKVDTADLDSCAATPVKRPKLQIDMDECDQQEFGRLVQDSQLKLRTSFKKCDKKVASLESTRQRAVNSLENLKSDTVDAITKAQDKVNEITTKEIENVKQQYGPLPQPVPNGYTCNRQAFTLEIQNISSRITDVKRKNIKTNLGAKIAVPIQDARASVKRKVDTADLDSCAATPVKRPKLQIGTIRPSISANPDNDDDIIADASVAIREPHPCKRPRPSIRTVTLC